MSEAAPFDLDAVLTGAYARSAGVDQRPLDALVAEVRASISAGEVTQEALAARRDALRRVEVRCIVSRVQGQFLDRVLSA